MKYKQVCWASKSILQKKENIRDLPWVRQMIQNNNNKATWFQFSYKTFWHFFLYDLRGYALQALALSHRLLFGLLCVFWSVTNNPAGLKSTAQ